MQQTQQQQQQQTSAQQPQQQRNNSSTTVTAQIPKTQKPSVKSTTSSGNVSNNSGSSNATNNARSSPKPKVWSHVQVSKILKNYHFTLNIDAINMNLYLGTKLISFTLFKRKTQAQSFKGFSETSSGFIYSSKKLALKILRVYINVRL